MSASKVIENRQRRLLELDAQIDALLRERGDVLEELKLAEATQEETE